MGSIVLLDEIVRMVQDPQKVKDCCFRNEASSLANRMSLCRLKAQLSLLTGPLENGCNLAEPNFTQFSSLVIDYC